MPCPHCQQANPAEAQFCLACGMAFQRPCPRCGTDLRPQARFCIACGRPLAPPSARAPDAPGWASPADAERPAAGPARIRVERQDILHALYQQGLEALRRRDRAGAIAALTPVVEEAPDIHPEARAALELAVQDRAGSAANIAPTAGPRLGRTVPPAAAGLRSVGARLTAPAARRAAPAWALAVMAVVLILGSVYLHRRGVVPVRAAETPEATSAAAVESDGDLFARCDAAVGAESWAEAIRVCRILRARAPDYAGLDDRLAAAYVGRGEERLAGDDLDGAAGDFGQALGYQPESAAAQSASARLALYQQGNKALDGGNWPAAVAQLGAVYAEAPDYQQHLDERSVKRRLFAAWLAWGQSALNADAAPDAAQRCAQALALVPDAPDAQRCLEAASDLGEADEPADDLLEPSDDDAASFLDDDPAALDAFAPAAA